MSKPIIFLDVDGVLNAHEFDPETNSNRIDRDKVVHLNTILRATGAEIVLSSAWRYIIHRGEMTLEGMRWLLASHGVIASRLIGLTREDTMIYDITQCQNVPWPNERGAQIGEWRQENGHDGPYVVLDDVDMGITDAGHPWVAVDGLYGLSDLDAAEAIAILLAKEVATL